MALLLKMCLDSIHFFSALFLSFSLVSLSSLTLKTKAALGHVAANSFFFFPGKSQTYMQMTFSVFFFSLFSILGIVLLPTQHS